MKFEFMNPGGSIKDRMALLHHREGRARGAAQAGAARSSRTPRGNTGMGVALAAAVKGYRCIFTMPDKMSLEKQDTAQGAGRAGGGDADERRRPTRPQSYYETGEAHRRETPGSFYLNQYHNPDNIEAHYRLTAPEVWEHRGPAGRFRRGARDRRHDERRAASS